MSPAIVFWGTLSIIWAAFIAVVWLPTATISQKPSEIWRPISGREGMGRDLYIANGCTYCHSQYIRPQDWGLGAERIAQPGDYRAQEPHLLGSERTGPDLSQQGGEHPNDWHIAHFLNPRNTSPLSLMPRFQFLNRGEIDKLTDYVQSLGGKYADYRVARQDYWKKEVVLAYQAGTDYNFRWLHSHVPPEWRNMPSPYPADDAAVARGERVYQVFCIGCHGEVGDGHGIAAPYLMPVPVDFTAVKRQLPQGKYVGGLYYYQIMNGITGSAMPYFKKHLESEKIWDVGSYVARNFTGYTDYHLFRGIDAPYINPENPNQQFKPNIPNGAQQ